MVAVLYRMKEMRQAFLIQFLKLEMPSRSHWLTAAISRQVICCPEFFFEAGSVGKKVDIIELQS
jgi:hypothetical protein